MKRVFQTFIGAGAGTSPMGTLACGKVQIMKHINLKRDVMIIGEKNDKNGNWFIDYYIVIPHQERMYAFTRKYSGGIYDLCKNGIMVNELTTMKTRNKAVMNLVKYVNRMLPYFTEYYELPLAG